MGAHARTFNKTISKKTKYITDKRRGRREVQGKYNVNNDHADRINHKKVEKEMRLPKTKLRIAEKKARNEKLKAFKASQNSTMDIEK